MQQIPGFKLLALDSVEAVEWIGNNMEGEDMSRFECLYMAESDELDGAVIFKQKGGQFYTLSGYMEITGTIEQCIQFHTYQVGDKEFDLLPTSYR